MIDREPDTFVTLGESALQAVDTCATAFRTDQRVLPPDQADTRLWGPMAGTSDDRYASVEAIEGIDLSIWP